MIRKKNQLSAIKSRPSDIKSTSPERRRRRLSATRPRQQQQQQQQQQHYSWQNQMVVFMIAITLLFGFCPLMAQADSIGSILTERRQRQRRNLGKNSKSIAKKGPSSLTITKSSGKGMPSMAMAKPTDTTPDTDTDDDKSYWGSSSDNHNHNKKSTKTDKQKGKGGKKSQEYYNTNTPSAMPITKRPTTKAPITHRHTTEPTPSPTESPVANSNNDDDSRDIRLILGQDTTTGEPVVYNVTQEAAKLALSIDGRETNDFLIDLIKVSPTAPIGMVCLLSAVKGNEEYYINSQQDSLFYVANGKGFLHTEDGGGDTISMGVGSLTLIAAGQGRSFFNTHPDHTAVVACLAPAIAVNLPTLPLQNVQPPTDPEILASKHYFQTSLGPNRVAVDLLQQDTFAAPLQWDILYTSPNMDFSAASLAMKPQTAQDYHSYSDFEVLYVVVQGNHVAVASAVHEDCWIPVPPGDGILIPIGTLHKVIHYGSGNGNDTEDAIVFVAFSPGNGVNSAAISSSYQVLTVPPASSPSCPAGTVPGNQLVR